MRMNKLYKGLISILAVAIITATVSLAYPEGLNRSSKTKNNIIIGISKEYLASLCIIASERGYFKSNGLNITVKYYPSGKIALESIDSDNLDLVTVAGTPIAYRSFYKHDFSILTSIGTADNDIRIIARKDKGILQPKDLRNKNVATQKNSAVHFFLSMFLAKYGMSVDDVKLSFLNPDELQGALIKGEIDACSMREPIISTSVGLLGKNAITFEDPTLSTTTFYLIVKNNTLNSKEIDSVLRAILMAEEFVKNNPNQAFQVIASKIGSKETKIPKYFQTDKFSVRLDQSDIIGLEAKARWLIRDKLVDVEKIPNYLDFISSTYLRNIRPEAVNLIQ